MSATIFPDSLTLLHNPRCSKSRAAKMLLEERSIAFRERRYLDEPLSRSELEALAQRLGLNPAEWVRRGEAAYAEAGLDAASGADAILDAMVRFPILIERPILVSARAAVIGRPPERIVDAVKQWQSTP